MAGWQPLGTPLQAHWPHVHPHRWFCHVDDDNYVNPKALLKLLKAFPPTLDVYVGRPSLNRPIHASEPRPHNRTVCSSLTPSYAGHCSPGQARFGVRAGPGKGPGWGKGCGGVGRVSGFQMWPGRCVFGLVDLSLILSLLCETGRQMMLVRQRDWHIVGPWSLRSTGF